MYLKVSLGRIIKGVRHNLINSTPFDFYRTFLYNTVPFMKHEILLEGKMPETFQAIERKEDPLPICIEIHPTDFCNQGCLYCFGSGQGREGIITRQTQKYMSIDDYSALFHEMASKNIKDLSISGGGEPFLSSDIYGIFSLALDNGLRVRTVTNGNVLNQGLIDLVLRTQEIRFSIDTPDPMTYSKMRRVSPALHAKTINNIDQLVRAKSLSGSSLEIGATCIVGEDNAEQIEALADLMLGQLNIDHLIIKSDIYGNVKPSSGEQDSIATQITRVEDKYGDRVDHRSTDDEFETGKPCVVPHFKAVINPYGEFYSCCLGAQPGEKNGYRFGDVKSEIEAGNPSALITVWDRTKKVRDQMYKNVGCTNCNHTDRRINDAYSNQ